MTLNREELRRMSGQSTSCALAGVASANTRQPIVTGANDPSQHARSRLFMSTGFLLPFDDGKGSRELPFELVDAVEVGGWINTILIALEARPVARRRKEGAIGVEDSYLTLAVEIPASRRMRRWVCQEKAWLRLASARPSGTHASAG